VVAAPSWPGIGRAKSALHVDSGGVWWGSNACAVQEQRSGAAGGTAAPNREGARRHGLTPCPTAGCALVKSLVPEEGVEPSRCCHHWILNPACAGYYVLANSVVISTCGWPFTATRLLRASCARHPPSLRWESAPLARHLASGLRRRGRRHPTSRSLNCGPSTPAPS